MRTIQTILDDFRTYLFEKTNNENFSKEYYESLLDKKKIIYDGKLFAKLNQLCYTKSGMKIFFKFILGDMTYAGSPEPIIFTKLFEDWSKIVRKGDHIGVLCPRQHGKTKFWSTILVIYRLSMFKNYNILLESASADQAEKILAEIKFLIDSNEFFNQKRKKDDKWSTDLIEYNNGKIVAKGIGSEVRGGTYDLIINDDLLRSDNKLSDKATEKFVMEELEPMIFVRKGQLIIIGTKKNHTDIFSTVKEKSKTTNIWVYKHYKAIKNYETREILCPERFTFNALIRVKLNIGSKSFEKEYQCEVGGEGSAVFNQKYINIAKEKGLEHILHHKPQPGWTYTTGVDLARAGSASADYSVFLTIGKNEKTNQKIIANIWRKKGMKMSLQAKTLSELARTFDYPRTLVEKNNVGQDFIDIIRDEHGIPVESFTTTANSKEDMIRLLVVAFENEEIIIPQGDEESREVMEPLLNELSKFIVEITPAGNERMKGSGSSHDDTIISLALANKLCKREEMPLPISYERTTELERYVQTGDLMEWRRG